LERYFDSLLRKWIMVHFKMCCWRIILFKS